MKKLIAVLGVFISVGALYWALKDINFAAAGAALTHIEPGVFLLGFIPWTVAIGSKVFRWRLLYYPDQQRAPYGHLTTALLIGYLFNTVLPLRTGEIVRATALRVTAGLPVARTLSTILVEKVLDTMALVAMLGIILPFISLPEEFKGPAVAAAVAFGGLFVAVLAAAALPDVARGLIARVAGILPARLRAPMVSLSNQVLAGLVPLRRPEVAPGIVGWTVLSWATNVTATYLFLRSFGLALPPTAPTLVVDATNLVMTVPSAPGYVGVYHATARLALQVFGVGADSAIAVATILHVIGFAPLAVAGFIGMLREGLSWGSVQSGAAAPAAEDAVLPRRGPNPVPPPAPTPRPPSE